MSSEWALPPDLTLRIAGHDDEPFLWMLFCSVRPELAQLPLPPDQLTQLMRQQYGFQQHAYNRQYPQAEHWIIEKDGSAVGKILFEYVQSSVHIIDFIVAPEWRGRGIGRSILIALKAYADAKICALSLRVDRQNSSAKRLYQQLGFGLSQSSDTHEFLIWPL